MRWRSISKFVLGSLAVASVLALMRGWSNLSNYLLLILGVGIVWAAGGLISGRVGKRHDSGDE